MRLLPLLALCLVTVSGCKAVDAMDNTEKMKTDLGDMKNTTGGMAKTTDDLDANMKNLHGDAAISVGMGLIVDPANTRDYAPPSTNLVAGAKLIAENMKSADLIEFMFGKLKELRETKPKDSEFNPTYLGNYRPDYVLQFNREQQVRVITLQAIAGQIPQAMVEQLIDEQINRGGNRVETMYTTLMLRAMYIDSIQLQQDSFSTAKPWSTLGQMNIAAERTANLDFVASLPYADQITFAATPTCFLPVVNPPVLQSIPNVYTLKDPKDAPDATDEQKEANQKVRDANKILRDAQDEYVSLCSSSRATDARCYPTLGDAPSFDISLDPSMAKHWWRKISSNITAYLNSFRDGKLPQGADEMGRIRDNAAVKGKVISND